VITTACPSKRKKSADLAVDDNEGKGYDHDVKRLCQVIDTAAAHTHSIIVSLKAAPKIGASIA